MSDKMTFGFIPYVPMLKMNIVPELHVKQIGCIMHGGGRNIEYLEEEASLEYGIVRQNGYTELWA